jgi:dTDP-4-amino-4,6-dideoxygalactose transaminase
MTETNSPKGPHAVPFFRPDITDDEIKAAVASLTSGWLTTGPRVKAFEEQFAKAIGAKYALALNSATAALHLAVEALGLQAGQGVLVPTQTFAATAEIVRYLNAIPILVDCDPVDSNMDLLDAERKMADLKAGRLPPSIPKDTKIVGIIPVHVAGIMMDMSAVQAFASRHGLWVVEDAAHAFPSGIKNKDGSTTMCGQNTSAVACFSFYANKTITTGEGGMAATDDEKLYMRMKLMALHGLSHDAWSRYAGGRQWDYRIIAPGYKYNLTDVAGAIGGVQLQRAEAIRVQRAHRASQYFKNLAGLDVLQLPRDPIDRLHSWHLFRVHLHLEKLKVDRNEFVDAVREAGIGCSVHWRPLHLHPYYEETYGWSSSSLPRATEDFARTFTLPLFSAMTDTDVDAVCSTLHDVARRFRR